MLAKLVDFGQQNGWIVKVFPIYEDTEHGRVYLWEERYGPEWVKKKLEEIPESAFAQEYLQRPGSSRKDIKPEDFKFYDKEFESVLEAIEYGRYIVCIGVDPAAKTGERNDYTAVVPVALDPATGIKYVLPGYIERASFNTKIHAVINEHIRWKAHITGIESVQFQIALKEAIDLEARRQGVTINTVPVQQSIDKKMRISRLYGAISAGTIRFLRHRTHSVIVDQLINLHTADHDDGADALEIAIRLHDDRRKRERPKVSHAVAEF
jgi:predicted phage terminase large subunit-like protein